MSKLKLYHAIARVSSNSLGGNTLIVYNAFVPAKSIREALKEAPTIKKLKRDYRRLGYDDFERFASEVEAPGFRITVTSLDDKVR